MDASMGSDPNDSQATQQLLELLEPGTDSSRKLSDARGSALKSQSTHSNEISSDSLPSSRHSNSLPQYHFHGLASTQTQSQQYEDEEAPNGGSQKENVGTSKTAKERGLPLPSPVSRSTSPHASLSKKVQPKGQLPDNRAGPSKAAGKKAPAANNFQSPKSKTSAINSQKKPLSRQSPYKPTMTRYNPSRRPPSRTSSQDSFAQDPDNREDLYLANSEQFGVPLSELGGGSSGRNASNATSGPSHSRGRQPIVSSPPRGRVLVEATPSHSGASVSPDGTRKLSHHFEEATQLIDEPETKKQRQNDAMVVDGDGNGSGYESSEPTSSFKRFLDGERDPEPEMQATQPSTQVEDSNVQVPSEDAIPWSNLRSEPTPSSEQQRINAFWENMRSAPSAPSTSKAQSGPQPLTSNVAPENRWRYRNYDQSEQLAHASNPPVEPGAPPSVSSSILQETQPSFPVEPSRALKRSFPVVNVAARRGPPAEALRDMSPMTVDSTEVVPDSEPLAEQEMRNPRKRIMSPIKQKQFPTILTTRSRVVEDDDVHMESVDATTKSTGDKDNEWQEEEDEEDDVPLATLAKGNAGKILSNKGRAHANIPPPRKATAMTKPIAPLPLSKDKKESTTALKPPHKPSGIPGPSKLGRSWENSEIPSSVPEQDARSDPGNLRKQKAIQKASKAPPARIRPSSRNSAAPSKSRIKRAVAGSDDEPSMLEEVVDDGTEPADEEYQQDEEEDVATSKKRKRAPTKAVTNSKTTKVASKRPKRNVPTPATRSIKRLRSAISTASRASIAQATRVFALWKQDSHYYPGTIYSVNTDAQYLVKFDDETDAWVSLDQIRLCKLRIGDDVLVPNRPRPVRVVCVDDEENGNGSIQVNLDDDATDMHISSLKIANKTILYAWGDRILTPQTISTVIKPVKANLSPSPSKLSMLSVPSNRGGRKKVLANTGLIVTLSATKGNWEKEKESILNAVKNSGGNVIDELSSIFRMEGKHSHNNNRWVITRADFKWIGDTDIERLFLIADDPNQKPKFLIALALGIPCLSTTWLYDSVSSGEEKEWSGYMLSQGYSAILHARPSQQVDVDWGNSVHQLRDIASNTVPCKLFADKSILCVGSEMVLQAKGKRRAGVEEKSQETTNAIPRIILAMGAEMVETVTETRYAGKDLSDYDYIVIREASQYTSEFEDCTTVHWTWVKDCLIASRYLALPSWTTTATEYSQET